jgi:hypothetical protein
MSLLQGSVLFIDDEIFNDQKPAYELAEQLRSSGRPVAAYAELPPAEHSAQWRSLGFVIVDWDLVPGSPGGIGGSTLSEFARKGLFEWLERFTNETFCPVFVISAEDTGEISRQIGDEGSLAGLLETGRLAVFAKSVLMEDFVGYLENWVASRPALAAMNIWITEVESATNRLFIDMDGLDPDWPIYVWRRADEDKIDPSFELASVISANLMHRVNPLQFDIPAISAFVGDTSGGAMRRVAQGRTAIPADRLYPTMVLPGDLFSDPADGGLLWVNVTPACHTVLNRPPMAGAEPDPDSVRMQLVPGHALGSPGSKSAMETMKKKFDGSNGMLVHTLMGENPYAFDFRGAEIRSWGDLRERRVGRLLPPYITLLQQRYAAYLMNEGLPRVDWNLYAD